MKRLISLISIEGKSVDQITEEVVDILRKSLNRLEEMILSWNEQLRGLPPPPPTISP